MSEDRGYVIELAGEAAGLVVKEGNRFRFYSAARDFYRLDRTLFRSPADAEEACRRVAFPGRAPHPQEKDVQEKDVQSAPLFREASRRGVARYIRQATLPYRRRLATP